MIRPNVLVLPNQHTYIFIQVDSVRMMGMLLIVAVKPVHLQHIRDIRTTYTKTALFGLLVRPFLKTNQIGSSKIYFWEFW